MSPFLLRCLQYECARWSGIFPCIRFVGFGTVCFRLVIQVLDSLYRLLVDDPLWGVGMGDDAEGVSSVPVRARRRSVGRGRNAAASPAAIQLAASLQEFELIDPAPIPRTVFLASEPNSPTSRIDADTQCVICLNPFPTNDQPGQSALPVDGAEVENVVPISSIPSSIYAPTIAAAPRASASALSSSSSSPSSPSRRSARVFLPCAHSFHRSCIESWFRTCINKLQPQMCPTCRHVP
jgi:hypothetical protein